MSLKNNSNNNGNPAGTYLLKLTMEAPEQSARYVQS